MAFPKIPYRPVTGQLKLSIKAPTIEVTVGEEEPTVDNGPDVSNGLAFKLPRGFSMRSDPREVIEEQHRRVAKLLSELMAKREVCGACKRATSVRMIEVSEEMINNACETLIEAATTVKIRFNQERDGTLVTYLETPNKTLGLKVMTSAVEVGYFFPNGLSSEKKYRITDFTPAEHSGWLVDK